MNYADDIPEGWAGSMMIQCDSDKVETWAYDNLLNARSNIIVKNYGDRLCEVLVRKPIDLTLIKLRWS